MRIMRTMHATNAIELSRIQLKIEIERERERERHLDIDFATRCTSCSSSNFACPFLMRVEQKSSWPPRQIGITANRQIALIFALRSGKRRSFFCLANCFIMCVPSFPMIFTWESHSQTHHSYAALDAQTNVTFVTCVRRFF